MPSGVEDSRSVGGVKSKVKSQKAKVKTAEAEAGEVRCQKLDARSQKCGRRNTDHGVRSPGDRRQARWEVALAVLLVQVPKRRLARLLVRGQERRLLVDLL